MKEMAPCKDCPNRSAACHASCYDYKAWVARMQKLKSQRMKRQHDEMTHVDYVKEAYGKMHVRGANQRRQLREKGIRRTQ